MFRPQRLLSVSLFVVWAGLTLACGGCPTREDMQKELAAANASWDSGNKADAARKYKDLYVSRWTSAAEKEKMLPRIVEVELKAGRTDEAKTWLKRGLDDKLNVEYADPAARNLLTVARKEHEEEARRKQAEAEAETKRRDEERAAENKRRNDEWEANAKRKKEEGDRILGEWRCTSEIMGDEPVRPSYHRKWAISSDRLTINGDRVLRYELDSGADPKRLEVYNQVGSRKVVVYSCIYKLDGSKLVVCAGTGLSFPSDFRADPNEPSLIMLTFTK